MIECTILMFAFTVLDNVDELHYKIQNNIIITSINYAKVYFDKRSVGDRRPLKFIIQAKDRISS